LIVDTGQWWFEKTGLPLPLGANGVRRDLGPKVIADVHRLLRESIAYGLEHRDEALGYAESFGRGLSHAKADQFVEMYVNHWTLDFGPVGKSAVARLLAEGHRAGIIPKAVEPEFVE
jgi:1,4-dihydroxy-6-naphthoate synthase